MSTTVKRQSICLTLETKRQLDFLCDIFGENPTKIMSRAIDMLYDKKKLIDSLTRGAYDAYDSNI